LKELSLLNKYLWFTKVNKVYIQILIQNPKDLCLSGLNNFPSFSSFLYILYPDKAVWGPSVCTDDESALEPVCGMNLGDQSLKMMWIKVSRNSQLYSEHLAIYPLRDEKSHLCEVYSYKDKLHVG
ncbi:mCG124478, partial [Mus musculus]